MENHGITIPSYFNNLMMHTVIFCCANFNFAFLLHKNAMKHLVHHVKMQDLIAFFNILNASKLYLSA